MAKTSDKKNSTGFLSTLTAPAGRALQNKKIITLKALAQFTETEILALHGVGNSTIPKLHSLLATAGLRFKENAKVSSDILTTKDSDPAGVDKFISQLKHPLLPEIKALRKIILSADQSIGEEIAWNAPSFFYTGKMRPFNPKEYRRFMVIFNLFKKDCVRLIFLTGARIDDQTGLLQGKYTDGRRLALFHNMNDVKANEKTLRIILQKSLQLLEN